MINGKSVVRTLAVLAAAAMVTPVAGRKPKSHATLKCPVTKLPIANVSVAVGKSAYHGKVYYFCTSNCKTLFDKNPKKYLGK